jgi:hypothetical protein
MLDFKIQRLDNVKFNHAELIAYYHTLKHDYDHMKWQATTGEFSDLAYSWAIQTKMKDATRPCSPYHLPTDDPNEFIGDFDRPTELIFGFGKKIIDAFPEVKQTVITVHYPGSKLPWHIDAEEYLSDHWKIHIPIETNNFSYFLYEGEKFVLETGHAYLVNTSINHATDNQGTTERAHLIFKIPVSHVDAILNTEYIL